MQVAKEGIVDDRHDALDLDDVVFAIGFKLDLDLDDAGDGVALKDGDRQWVHIDEFRGVFDRFLDLPLLLDHLGSLERTDTQILERSYGTAHQHQQHGE